MVGEPQDPAAAVDREVADGVAGFARDGDKSRTHQGRQPQRSQQGRPWRPAERPQQQRRGDDEPQVRPQVPQGSRRLLRPRVLQQARGGADVRRIGRCADRDDIADQLDQSLDAAVVRVPRRAPLADEQQRQHHRAERPQRWQQSPDPAPDDPPRRPVQRTGHQRARQREHHSHGREQDRQPGPAEQVVRDHADQGDRAQQVQVAVAARRRGRRGRLLLPRNVVRRLRVFLRHPTGLRSSSLLARCRGTGPPGASTTPVRRSFCQRRRPPVRAVIQDWSRTTYMSWR